MADRHFLLLSIGLIRAYISHFSTLKGTFPLSPFPILFPFPLRDDGISSVIIIRFKIFVTKRRFCWSFLFSSYSESRFQINFEFFQRANKDTFWSGARFSKRRRYEKKENIKQWEYKQQYFLIKKIILSIAS